MQKLLDKVIQKRGLILEMVSGSKIILLIISLIVLSGCMKTTCISPNNCEKKVDWKDPKFSLFRTIITNGTNLGN